MVELSSKTDPFQFGFPNAVFIIPAILFVGLSAFFGYKLYKSLVEKEQKKAQKQQLKAQKKKK